MELNEIKKALYKEKPVAVFKFIRKGVAYYSTTLDDKNIVNFEIPCNDMGDSDFLYCMEAQHLNRWIVLNS